jgi:hypothetical protein
MMGIVSEEIRKIKENMSCRGHRNVEWTRIVKAGSSGGQMSDPIFHQKGDKTLTTSSVVDKNISEDGSWLDPIEDMC